MIKCKQTECLANYSVCLEEIWEICYIKFPSYTYIPVYRALPYNLYDAWGEGG